MPQNQVLIVEDSASLRRIYAQYVEKESVLVDTAATLAEANTALDSKVYQVVLLDLRLPDGDGFDLLKRIIEHKIKTLVIIMTAHGSIDVAVDAIRLGAYDFLEKPFDARRLKVAISSAFAQVAKLNFAPVNMAEKRERNTFHSFIGASPAMQDMYHLIERAGPSKASVFVTGESGSGKELTAEALHKQSARSEGPFVAINCAAIPKDLMESEIFGHVKGAFTGASANRDGAASKANGGTLFLDEIGEMSLDLQTKLLRFIQTGIIQKVGSNSDELVDVRFICATNRDPMAEVQAGRFREDLYYRLHVIPVHLPPLRDRGDDILLIAEFFLNRYAREETKYFEGFDVEAERRLLEYHWPGNVRELQNVIRNVVVLNEGGLVSVDHFPAPLKSLQDLAVPTPVKQEEPEEVEVKRTSNKTKPYSKVMAQSLDEIEPLELLERKIIENAVKLCKGNVPKAAALLEVSPSTLYRKIKGWS